MTTTSESRPTHWYFCQINHGGRLPSSIHRSEWELGPADWGWIEDVDDPEARDFARDLVADTVFTEKEVRLLRAWYEPREPGFEFTEVSEAVSVSAIRALLDSLLRQGLWSER